MLPNCPKCHLPLSSSELCSRVVRFGSFKRFSDQARVQRFRCLDCRSSFSTASFHPCFQQKKRQLNPIVFKLLASGVSQRRSALILNLNRKTIVRKLIFLGQIAIPLIPMLNLNLAKAQVMEFDDLESFEHTKCKPLSVTMAVESKTRRILGFRIARMPAKGKLAAFSRKKYGIRKDERNQARESLFLELKSIVSEEALIKSDQCPFYMKTILKHFAKARHKKFKGRKAKRNGLGELKRGGFDPLFSVNHTNAMLRANINRLFQKTWCTTKLAERLSYHLALYCLYHNQVLIQKKTPSQKAA